MLFNSYIFLFVFLPITLAGFHLIGSKGHRRIAISWLVLMSLFFYGWWNPIYLGLILISILTNYGIALALEEKPAKSILSAGIILNLALLAYFKYANFFIDNLNLITDSNITLERIILPLAISFFTFQQITFLIDAFRGETREHNFLQYCLFVTFFPQLIAGPIVHHKEMLPQFAKDSLYRLRSSNLAIGSTIFFIGLFKKVVIADEIALHATPVFLAAEEGVTLTFFEAWGGALAYTFQLYFDFCGYSEMALGAARMFGVILPINFYSPYRANNIIEFWRRWHITLSRFLRDYLYIPLGGSRRGTGRRYINLTITMLLGGLWHGAAWTFVIWGGLHGIYLVINHGWNAIKSKLAINPSKAPSFIGSVAGRTITFTAVVIAWVIFRAESISGATRMYEGMLGLNGFSLPRLFTPFVTLINDFSPETHAVAQGLGTFGSPYGAIKIFILIFIAGAAPNTIDLLKNHHPALGSEAFPADSKIEWKPNARWAILIALITVFALSSLTKASEFLYFQF